MATNLTLTVRDLIDEALAYLYRPQERPRTVPLSASLSDSATSVNTGEAGALSSPLVAEIGAELVLITGVDANGITAMDRGYADTTPAAHSSGDKVHLHPLFPRREVQRRIEQFFRGPANTYLPRYDSAVMNTSAGTYQVELPANTVKITDLRFSSASSGRIVHLGNWEMHENLPSSVSSTGKLLQVSGVVDPVDNLIVTYQVPHSFSTAEVTESSTVDVSFGSEDIPVLYAAATMITGRELTRLEMDSVEEWNQAEAIRQGIPVRYIQQLWQQYYRRLDEAARLQYRPKHRPYRKMQKGFV